MSVTRTQLVGNVSTGASFAGITTANNLVVGFGVTVSSNRRLEVSEATYDNFVRVNTTGANKSGIEFSNGGSVYSQLYFNNVAPYDFSLLQQYSTGSLIFGTNNTERMRITSAGLVGINTTTPQKELQINATTPTIRLEESTGSAKRLELSINSAGEGLISAPQSSSNLLFGTTGTERMRISSNGVVTVKNGAVAEIGTLTDGATITPDFASNCNFTVTLGGNRTIANPSNVTAGQSGSFFIVQDGTGGRTASWGANWDWSSGVAPTLSTAANAVDRIDYVCRSATSIHAVWSGSYS